LGFVGISKVSDTEDIDSSSILKTLGGAMEEVCCGCAASRLLERRTFKGTVSESRCRKWL
jgi:hypothetical protein